MYKTASETIFKYKMLNKMDHVVVGVSGGCDSMALIHFLQTIPFNLKLTVVHINHMLRGDESDRDCLFVKDYCQKNNLQIFSFNKDINNIAANSNVTLEEAGRIERYKCFYDVLHKVGGNKIAVAHNMPDQAETILMRIFRGTSLKGLAGIPPIRGEIIRPLINCSRNSIVCYCTKNNLEYVTDSSNNIEMYTRNKIRLSLLPYLEKEFNPKSTEAIAKMAEGLVEDELFIDTYAKKEFDSLVNKDLENKTVSINIDAICSCEKTIQKRIIKMAIEFVSKANKDISYQNIEDVLKLFDKDGSKKIDICHNVTVKKEYGLLTFIKNGKAVNDSFCYPLTIDKVYKIKELGIAVLISSSKINKINCEILYTKTFDYGKMQGSMQIRNRHAGDFICLKNLGSKKISDFFVDQKIPKAQRNKIPIFAFTDSNEVFCIGGYRANHRYTATAESKRKLFLYLWEDNGNEGSSEGIDFCVSY